MLLQMIAPGDIAIYATLCALATFPRTMIRAQLLDNDNFGMYIYNDFNGYGLQELIQNIVSGPTRRDLCGSVA